VTLAVQQHEGKALVHLEGSLDIAVAEDLKRILLEALDSAPRIEVDLSGVTYLDVTTLQLLWAARKEATARCTELIFDPQPSDAVRSILEETGFLQTLPATSVAASEEMG